VSVTQGFFASFKKFFNSCRITQNYGLIAIKYPYKGQCLCGSIKYEVDKLEEHMAHCHCSMCQKFHGAAFSTFGVAKTNHIKSYIASNGTERKFCDNCGSSLVFVPSNDSGKFVEFSLGTLDSEIEMKPDAHIFVKYAAKWYVIADDLPTYEEGRL